LTNIVSGQMYEIGPQPYPLSQAADPVADQQVYTASWMLSYPGNSGGPFYVELNGYYYPAAVYLGTLFSGVVPYASAVRAIDSNVVNLITLAASLGDSGTNNSGGGVITVVPGAGIASNPGVIEVTIAPPAAFTAGGAWKLSTLPATDYSTKNPSALPITSAAQVQLQFKPLSGWNLPASQSLSVGAGSVTKLTGSYTLALSWPASAGIAYGTPLGSAQLDAGAITSGTYAYTPPAGTVLSAGTNILSVTFTPSDTTDYGSAVTTNVSLVVSPAVVAPAIQSVRVSGSSFSFTWSTTASQTYQIQTTTNLAKGTWTNLGNVITATASNTTTAPVPATNAQQYYRIVLLP
jgi:hypothetical protein